MVRRRCSHAASEAFDSNRPPATAGSSVTLRVAEAADYFGYKAVYRASQKSGPLVA